MLAGGAGRGRCESSWYRAALRLPPNLRDCDVRNARTLALGGSPQVDGSRSGVTFNEGAMGRVKNCARELSHRATWAWPPVLIAALLSVALAYPHNAAGSASDATPNGCKVAGGTLWSSTFSTGLGDWGTFSYHWGRENLSFLRSVDVPGNIMRVRLPEGSFDPHGSKKAGRPVGGTGFQARMLATPLDCAFLRYRLRFAPDFDFVRGGKLPGLFGGVGNSGGKIPVGTDGFSTRYMWGKEGRGQVYAYLPTSNKYGTPIGRGAFSFVPGKWHQLEQQVVLNDPGHSNGVIRVWFDGRKVIEAHGLRFRDISTLKIDGVFFDLFFGGSDPSWATPKDTYVEFADFSIRGSRGAQQ